MIDWTETITLAKELVRALKENTQAKRELTESLNANTIIVGEFAKQLASLEVNAVDDVSPSPIPTPPDHPIHVRWGRHQEEEHVIMGHPR